MLHELAEKLKKLESEALERLIALKLSAEAIESFKIQYLGRNGKITEILKEIKGLSPEDRPKLGEIANRVKGVLTEKLNHIQSDLKLETQKKILEKDRLDVTLPGRASFQGGSHPLMQTMDELISIFSRYGFQVATGPEIESEYYNFYALNTPKDHPARDMQDTFYIKDQGTSPQVVLRTHTSPVQIRVMEKFKPPIRVIAPGVVYRHDHDVSHTPMFHQIEGLLIDENVSMGHLKGILTAVMHRLFSPSIKVRFRPSFFPFTEPSAELDIECVACHGKGCRVCKESGWLEVLGCGMVHPQVLRGVKLNPEKYTGYAFGMGIERLSMIRYGIDDIRLFFENDVRFLRQFI